SATPDGRRMPTRHSSGPPGPYNPPNQTIYRLQSAHPTNPSRPRPPGPYKPPNQTIYRLQSAHPTNPSRPCPHNPPNQTTYRPQSAHPTNPSRPRPPRPRNPQNPNPLPRNWLRSFKTIFSVFLRGHFSVGSVKKARPRTTETPPRSAALAPEI